MKIKTNLMILLLCSMNFLFAQEPATSNLEKIKAYLQEKGINEAIISGLKVNSQSFSKSMGATNVYVQQHLNDIPIQSVIGSFLIKEGKVVYHKMNFYNKPIQKTGVSKKASISAKKAYQKAISVCQITPKSPISETIQKSNNTYAVKSADKEIAVQLTYVEKERILKLCWNVVVESDDKTKMFSVDIDAISGNVVAVKDMVTYCNFDHHYLEKHHHHHHAAPKMESILEQQETATAVLLGGSYTVFELPLESPIHGERTSVSGMEDNDASPFGWHDTDGADGVEFTTTRGNNANVFEGFPDDGVDNYQPDGGEQLIFDFPFDPNGSLDENEDAALTNLFYITNRSHDIFYHYGFDEESGNFQENNYGRGGLEGDAVQAILYDAGSDNNASFSVGVDGGGATLRAGIWSPGLRGLSVNNTDLQGLYTLTPSDTSTFLGDSSVPDEGVTGDLVIATNDQGEISGLCDIASNAADFDGKIVLFRQDAACEDNPLMSTLQDAGAIAIIRTSEDAAPIIAGFFGQNIPIVSISDSVIGDQLIARIEDGEEVNISLLGGSEKELAVGRDSGVDNSIMVHEYGHGVTFRLVGGAENVQCLNGAENMREGWSDYFGLLFSIQPGDTGETGRGFGTYVGNEATDGLGIRNQQYSTDMSINPVTYADVSELGLIHEIGAVFASALWDFSWELIDRDGFDPDWINGTGGNNLAMQIAMNSLKLMPCNPGFIEGRDALLAAADLSDNPDENKCIIWETFARRGMGYSAEQGTSNSATDQVAAFDLPPNDVSPCNAVLSVNEVTSDVFSIDPNPSSGSFFIRTAKDLGTNVISIVDMNGRIIYQKEASLAETYEVHAAINPGIYILQIEGQNTTSLLTTKIVVR